MNKGETLVVLGQFALLTIFLIFITFSASAAAPVVVIISPNGDGNYLQGDSNHAIIFTVGDDDANSALDSDLRAHIYLSTSAGDHTNTIVLNLNLMDITICGDQNFSTGTPDSTNTCSFDLNAALFPDGNFFIDVNVSDWNVGVGSRSDDTEDSSASSFVLDGIIPTITFLVPTGASTVTAKTVTFDLNDSLSPIDLSTLVTKVNGTTVTNIVTATDCTKIGDFNYLCTYTESGITADGDYNVSVSISDLASNASNGSGDTNVAFTYDTSAATLTISSPSGGMQQENVFSIRLVYSSTDSDIAEYYVQLNSETEISNGTNTSYTFSDLGVGTYTLKVHARDNVDNNSAVSSVVITIIASGGGSPAICGDNVCNGLETSSDCPQDCSSVCGDGACTNTENSTNCPSDCGPTQVCGNGTCDSGENYNVCPQDCEAPKGQTVRETILSMESKGKPTLEDIKMILEAVGASPNAIEKAGEALAKTNVTRKFEVIREEDEDGNEKFITIIEIIVENKSGKTLMNVKVVEEIPKQALGSAKNVVSSIRFNILKDDPIVEFEVGEIPSGQTKSFKYTIDDKLTESQIILFSLPFVSDFFEKTDLSCNQLNCEDSNPCTIDSCENSRCLNIPKPDGESCGLNLTCQQGQCTDDTGVIVVVDEEDNTGLIIGIVAVILIAIVAYTIYSKK